jgi:hypothetical protein
MKAYVRLFLLGTYIYQNNIDVQYSLFLWSLQNYVAQQHTEWIFALPLQQWITESTRMLRYTYIAYVVNLYRTV